MQETMEERRRLRAEQDREYAESLAVDAERAASTAAAETKREAERAERAEAG